MCQLPVYIPKWNHEFHHSVFGDTTLEEHLKQPFYKTVNAKTQDFFSAFYTMYLGQRFKSNAAKDL